MKKLFLLTLTALFFYSTSFATIRRVGFFGTPLPNIDYSTFASAYTASVAGDTILIFPNQQLSGTLTKKLTIIGPGNWLDPASTPKGNANEQANPGEATISTLFLDPGSDGTVVMGFHNGTIYITANNITIRRNRDILVYVAYNHTAGTALNVNNIQLLENYSLNVTHYYTNGSAITNLNISNNFMYSLYLSTLNTYSGSISNNVWAYDNTSAGTNGGSSTFSYPFNGIELGNGVFLFQNNILESYISITPSNNTNDFAFADGGNTVFNNNLAFQTNPVQNWGVGSGNSVTTNATGIFAAFPVIGSSGADARYQLGASSPALTAGAGGTAIGMFAGGSPYKLSTIPTIPSIYSVSSPQGNNPPGSTITINVSTRGNN